MSLNVTGNRSVQAQDKVLYPKYYKNSQQYTNSLVNKNLFYADYTQLEKILIAH